MQALGLPPERAIPTFRTWAIPAARGPPSRWPNITPALKLLAQNTSQEAPTAIFDAERAALDRRGMYVLGAWAVSNVGASGARYFATTGSEKYFHQMNVGWGAAKAQLRTENIYLLNTGLE